MPENVCAFKSKADCTGLTHYRTITGVCNNLERPYEGSSQTAFGRLLPAAYDDGNTFNSTRMINKFVFRSLLGIHLPRSQSVLGGPLPNCRELSLAMGSAPVFDTAFNNLFVTYGQFFVHDITLATPVTDSGRTPITSCTCSSHDPDTCNIVDVAASDPFMAAQKCIAMPATAQAFSDQMCTLGIKDQMNANSHYIDLSVTYGSTRATARGLRLASGGLLKSTTKPWSKLELPPGQRDSKSCIDANESQRCFAGGDSRLMENTLLAGIQTQWVRAHNIFARELVTIRPDWKNNDEILYEETKKILSALHQRYVYEDWLPILIGPTATQKFVGDNGLFSRYDPKVTLISSFYSMNFIFLSYRHKVSYSMKLLPVSYVFIHSFEISTVVVSLMVN